MRHAVSGDDREPVMIKVDYDIDNMNIWHKLKQNCFLFKYVLL